MVATETCSHMLKGDDKRRRKTWRDADVVHDAEMRYMDLDVRLEERGALLVVGACSDGGLRLLSVSQVGNSEGFFGPKIGYKTSQSCHLYFITFQNGTENWRNSPRLLDQAQPIVQ